MKITLKKTAKPEKKKKQSSEPEVIDLDASAESDIIDLDAQPAKAAPKSNKPAWDTNEPSFRVRISDSDEDDDTPLRRGKVKDFEEWEVGSLDSDKVYAIMGAARYTGGSPFEKPVPIPYLGMHLHKNWGDLAGVAVRIVANDHRTAAEKACKTSKVRFSEKYDALLRLPYEEIRVYGIATEPRSVQKANSYQ